MGKLLLVSRLGVKDVRHNRAETVLLLVAIAAAATTLTVALALHGVTSQPYLATRAATAGPDVVAAVQQQNVPAQLTALEHAPGVVGYSGPYLFAFPQLLVGGHSDPVLAEGRDASIASVDQPKLIEGRWVRKGGVVIERSLADLLGLKVGERVSLDHFTGGGGPGLAGGPSWSRRPFLRGHGYRRHRRSPAVRRSVPSPIPRAFPKPASSGSPARPPHNSRTPKVGRPASRST